MKNANAHHGMALYILLSYKGREELVYLVWLMLPYVSACVRASSKVGGFRYRAETKPRFSDKYAPWSGTLWAW